MSLYLGVAPVYWLPGTSPDLLRSVKIGLFTLAVGSVFIHGRSVRGVVPTGLLGPLGFLLLILLSVPGLIQAVSLSSAAEGVTDIIFGAVLFWCFFNTRWRGDIDPGVVLARSVALVSVFAALTVTNFLTGLPDWQSPYGLGLTDAGFGRKQTGWSNSIALYVPAVLFLMESRRTPKAPLRPVWCSAAFICLMASQFLAGGRAGILLSVLTLVVLVFLRPSSGLLAITALLVVAVVGVPENWYTHLRLDRLEGGVQSLHDLDHISAQRIGGYMMALELLEARLWSGYGLGQVIYETSFGLQTEIHNLWLKWAVSCGLLAPLVFLAMVLRLCRIAVLNLRCGMLSGDTVNVIVPGLILILGVMLSMVEPNALLGSFQISAVWWAAAGTVMTVSLQRKAVRWD